MFFDPMKDRWEGYENNWKTLDELSEEDKTFVRFVCGTKGFDVNKKKFNIDGNLLDVGDK